MNESDFEKLNAQGAPVPSGSYREIFEPIPAADAPLTDSHDWKARFEERTRQWSDAIAEVERLRAENARLRAEVQHAAEVCAKWRKHHAHKWNVFQSEGKRRAMKEVGERVNYWSEEEQRFTRAIAEPAGTPSADGAESEK